MAFKLNKGEINQRQALADAMETARTDLYDKIVEANALLEQITALMEPALEAYNDAMGGATEFVDDIKSKWQDEYDNKSERWQNSDAGQAANELINAWSDIEFEEVKPEFSEPMEIDIEYQHEILLELPDEKEEG